MVRSFIKYIIIKLLPLLQILRIQTFIINELTRIRHKSNQYDYINQVISVLPLKRKLIFLDVGAQGIIHDESDFLKKNEIFFNPILVEPISAAAEKLKKNI